MERIENKNNHKYSILRTCVSMLMGNSLVIWHRFAYRNFQILSLASPDKVKNIIYVLNLFNNMNRKIMWKYGYLQLGCPGYLSPESQPHSIPQFLFFHNFSEQQLRWKRLHYFYF